MAKKYKFIFQIITDDITITDQNVTKYEFRNIGTNDCTINNQFLLQKPNAVAGANPQFRYEEDIRTGEKTAQGYKLVFKTNVGVVINAVQMIQKVEVPNKD